MKIGIIQGRLSKPVQDHIQEFPINEWEREFIEAKEIGLTHIEWIVTENSFKYNPIFSKMLDHYFISSICCDNLINEKIYDLKFLQEMLTPICESAEKLQIGYLTIPILEKSSMENEKIMIEFIKNINIIHKSFPNLYFSFEPELSISKIEKIISSNDHFYVTYDTGNISSYGINHIDFIYSLIHKINNVHLKDRLQGKTVIPFSGDTDFLNIFKYLKELNYNSIFTMQLARNNNCKEKIYIKKMKTIFENMYENI